MQLMVFAAVGLGASAWSSYVHYSLLTRQGYTSFCDVNSAISCTTAYLSQYGSLWGVPVALGGVFYFLLVLALAGLTGRRRGAAENTPGYIFALSTFALAFVFYLAWASLFKLHALCVLCAITYAAVIAIFIVSGGATTFPMTSLPRRASKDLPALVRSPLALGVAVLLAVGAFSLITVFPREAHSTVAAQETAPAAAAAGPQATAADPQREEFLKWYEAQPKINVPIEAEGAKVLVVKFNDYQCPPCRESFMNYKSIIAKYTASGQMKFVLKHFPLERECNAAVGGDLHSSACEAAAAVVMAQPKGTADKLEEWFFTNQMSLSPDTIKKAAADVAGVNDYDAQYARALTLVKTDAGLGALLGAKSTPTFLINGRLIAGALPPGLFEAAVEHELRR
jgi:uncharacterized membrane protein